MSQSTFSFRQPPLNIPSGITSKIPTASTQHQTPEGITLKSSYSEFDKQATGYQLDYPGFAPFTRGPYPTMFVTKPWTVRQYAAMPLRS